VGIVRSNLLMVVLDCAEPERLAVDVGTSTVVILGSSVRPLRLDVKHGN